MAIFETHSHYFDTKFDSDREEVLEAMFKEHLEYILENATDVETSLRVIELAKKYEKMVVAVGIHPEALSYMNREAIDKIEELLLRRKENKIVAVGEIGLDYHYKGYDREKQILFFRKQLELAQKYQLPAVIHTREATNDTLKVLREYMQNGLRGVIHCFPESLEIAKEYVGYGMYIGVGGVVTYQNAKKLVEVVEKISLDSILIETDLPYLTPEPKRGMRNDSSNLKYVIQKIAQIKGIDEKTVEEVTYINAKRLFDIL